jgi:hypothetical protein
MELGSMDFPITAACRIDYGNNFLWFSILQTEQFPHKNTVSNNYEVLSFKNSYETISNQRGP